MWRSGCVVKRWGRSRRRRFVRIEFFGFCFGGRSGGTVTRLSEYQQLPQFIRLNSHSRDDSLPLITSVWDTYILKQFILGLIGREVSGIRKDIIQDHSRPSELDISGF